MVNVSINAKDKIARLAKGLFIVPILDSVIALVLSWFVKPSIGWCSAFGRGCVKTHTQKPKVGNQSCLVLVPAENVEPWINF
jgi:hypothetical protein